MSKQVQKRRGTSAEHSSFTGAIAEITVDTETNELVLGDGVTLGGRRVGISRVTTSDLVNSVVKYPESDVIETSGFTTSGDGGSGKWKQNGVTGQTPSQTPAQLADGLLNDASGNQWACIDAVVNASEFGATGDGSDATGALSAVLGSGSLSIWNEGYYPNSKDASFYIYPDMRNYSGGAKYKRGIPGEPTDKYLPVLMVEKVTNSKRSTGGPKIFDSAFYSQNTLEADATTFGTAVTGYIRSAAGNTSITGAFVDAIGVHGSGKAIGKDGRVWGLWGQAGNGDDGSGTRSSQLVGCELNLVNKFESQPHPDNLPSGEGPYRGLIVTTADGGTGCGIGIDVGDGSGLNKGDSGWWFGMRLRANGVTPSGDWKNQYLEDSVQLKIEGSDSNLNRYGGMRLGPDNSGEGDNFTYGINMLGASIQDAAAIILDEDHRIYFGGVQGVIKYVGMNSGSLNLNNLTVSINNTQVVGERKTGYGEVSGANNKTAWDTSTVTLEMLAEKVGALWNDLRTHGLIGD